MTDHALASFEAKDGTGRWEVFTWGIITNGQRYHFTKQSHIVCAGLPGRTEKHVYQTEEDDGFGACRLPGDRKPCRRRPRCLGVGRSEHRDPHRHAGDPRQRDALHRTLAPRPRRQPLPALPRGRPLGSSRCHPTLRRHHPCRHHGLPRRRAVTALTLRISESLQNAV